MGADAAGWLHHGMANRLCLDMGLNMDPARLEKTITMSAREIRLRRQIYWTMYFHDKLCASYTGRICSMLVCALPCLYIGIFTDKCRMPKQPSIYHQKAMKSRIQQPIIQEHPSPSAKPSSLYKKPCLQSAQYKRRSCCHCKLSGFIQDASKQAQHLTNQMVPPIPPQRPPTTLLSQNLSSRTENLVLRSPARFKNRPPKRRSSRLHAPHGLPHCQDSPRETVSHKLYLLGVHGYSTSPPRLQRLCKRHLLNSSEISALVRPRFPAQSYNRHALHFIRRDGAAGGAGLCIESESAGRVFGCA